MKEKRITIRLDNGDYELLEYLAKKKKTNISETVRKAINFYGGAVIGGRTDE